jgi:hypothetical protein
METLYPKIKVKLVGTDGNAYALMGKVKTALNKELVSKYNLEREEVNKISSEFLKEAMSGDYDNLLRTCMKYVEVR